jgi:hypothetical protein
LICRNPTAAAAHCATKVADQSKYQLATNMRVWSASAISRYYFDPGIKFLRSGAHGLGKPTGAGYFIVPHCDPDCCQAVGGVAMVDLGPFSTRIKARDWSRTYLAEPPEAGR